MEIQHHQGSVKVWALKGNEFPSYSFTRMGFLSPNTPTTQVYLNPTIHDSPSWDRKRHKRSHHAHIYNTSVILNDTRVSSTIIKDASRDLFRCQLTL